MHFCLTVRNDGIYCRPGIGDREIITVGWQTDIFAAKIRNTKLKFEIGFLLPAQIAT